MTSVSSFPAWLFFIGVILLQFGFVIREVGAVRIKDTKRIIIRHFVNLFISVVINSTCGFLFTYGDGVGDKFIGTNVANPIQFLVFTIGFQWMTAYIASAIVSGAVAERCKYIAHFISTVFITGFIHPVVRHWTLKGKGWLDYPYIGYQDSAGSGAVHVVGGIAALIGAMVIGPRTGRFEPSLKKDFTDRCNSARVAISAGSYDFEPYGAAIIGLIAAILYRTYSALFVRIGIDDPLDVVAVHFGGGSWGLIAVAFFHRRKGILYAWNIQSAFMSDFKTSKYLLHVNSRRT